MEPYFTRITCWVTSRPGPQMEEDAMGFYESSWDVRTNAYIKENLGRIQTALNTYPSSYCGFRIFYVPQPSIPEFGTEEEKWQDLDKKATQYHDSTSMEEGIIYCKLVQDRGREDHTSQRVMIMNLEDCKPQAILAAIQYMAQLSDQLKDEVLNGSGTIPSMYRREWRVDLAVDCKEIYDKAFGWLEGKNEMYFSQPILKYDQDSHRLWFVDSKGNLDEEFIEEHDLLAQAFYLLIWNHPEGIKDSDLYCTTGDVEKLEKVKALQEELASYYRILNPDKDKQFVDPQYYRKQVYSFCNKECRETRSTARSRIKKAFLKHETNRVNSDFAQKVAEYYSFDAKEGKIKVINRSTTIILPDSLMSDRLKKYNTEQERNAASQS